MYNSQQVGISATLRVGKLLVTLLTTGKNPIKLKLVWGKIQNMGTNTRVQLLGKSGPGNKIVMNFDDTFPPQSAKTIVFTTPNEGLGMQIPNFRNFRDFRNWCHPGRLRP